MHTVPKPFREFEISTDLDLASKVGGGCPHCIGNLGFQQIWTQHQKLVADPPPYREFGISADLDSASKVGGRPPPPPLYREFGISVDLDSVSKVGGRPYPFPTV